MRKIAHALFPVLLAVTAVAGCGKINLKEPSGPKDNGVAALSADEILAKARTAMINAGSFRMKGDVTQEGGKLSLDTKRRGGDIAGTFVMAGSDSTPKGKVDAIRVGNDTYFKGDATFWKSLGGKNPEGVAELLENKWVKPAGTDKTFEPMLKLSDPEELLKSNGSVTKGEVTKIGETDVIALKDGETTLYVATKGEPLPVRLEGPPNEGKVDFSEFGATFEEIKAPPSEEVVNMSKIQR